MGTARRVDIALSELLVALRLPDVTPRFGPDPGLNEWKMLPVGHPVWLWTDGPRSRSATASSQGVAFGLSATWLSTTFTMGDGRQVTCSATREYSSAVSPGTPSPVCGHVYTKPSLPRGSYTVTATATWQIDWSVSGVSSGSFRHSYSDSAELAVGELHALVVR
jgi:hypothetical protein